MRQAPIPPDDDLRVKSLRSMQLLSTPAELDFDRITRTAAEYFDVPIALVSLVDKDRQWFKSRYGLETPETAREISFSGHTINGNGAFVVTDARRDDRFSDNPLVTGEPHVTFYAGFPIRNAEGFRIGALCVIDRKPRQFTGDDGRRLEDFARWLEVVIENRRLGETQTQLMAELNQARRESMICPMTQAWNRRGFSGLMAREISRSKRDGRPVALAIIDIDHFKRINDSHGHPAGDTALVRLARTLREQIRAYDVFARLGGEEFAIIMPGLRREDAAAAGEKLRAAVEREGALPTGERLTISLGLGWFDPAKADLTEELMMTKADQALYKAKQGGRNRIAVEE
jgi:diguanylate cyclase (GGDEF)-like protein